MASCQWPWRTNGRSTPFARNATRIGKVATTAGVRQRSPPGPPEADNPGRPACSETGSPECDARPCRYSHRSRSTPRSEAPRPLPDVMQMRVAACQRKRHLDRRRHRHFDFQAPIARVMPLDEIGAKSGATTGKTVRRDRTGSSARRAAARGFTVDLALIRSTSTTCLAWISQHYLYDYMHNYAG